VDIYKFATYLLAGIQAEDTRIASLETRVGLLESGSGTGGSFTDYLASLGAKIVGGVAEFKGVVSDSIESKKGITTQDRATNAYYCMYMEGGVMKSSVGKCVDGITSSVASSSLVIKIIGDNPSRIEKGTSYSDNGATFVNHLGETVYADVWNNSAVIVTNSVGTSTVVYVANDGAGNTATSTRTVVVFDPSAPESPADTTPPVITIVGDNPLTIVGTSTVPFTDPGATALDAVSGASAVEVSGLPIDPSVVSTSIIYYASRDTAGNWATSTRTVIISE
jgi:hypothetical protein